MRIYKHAYDMPAYLYEIKQKHLMRIVVAYSTEIQIHSLIHQPE